MEIKSSETINADLFDSLKKWYELAQATPAQSYSVYGGDFTHQRAQGNIVSWKNAGSLIKQIIEHKLS